MSARQRKKSKNYSRRDLKRNKGGRSLSVDKSKHRDKDVKELPAKRITGLFLYTLGHFSLDEVLTGIKIVFIVVFISLASPTATHAIFDAGMKAGAPPWTKGKKRR